MKKKTIKRNILSVLAVFIMLMATLLTACSSGQATEIPANEETTKAEVKEETPAVEQAEEVATPEPTEEPTPEPEPTPEAVVYEGIDMESTLPGLEWIATFDGIIDEPKLVIFNDETNKKVIVENGQKVEFSDTDTLATYAPYGKEVSEDTDQNDSAIFGEISFEGNITLYKGLFIGIKDGEEIPLKYIEKMDGNEYELTVTLVAQKGE